MRRTWDVRIGAVDAGGAIVEQALPPAEPAPASEPMLTELPTLSPASDGSLWMTERSRRHVDLVRIRPAVPLPLGDPRARALRVVARDGARLWVQVACRARPGLLCGGRLRLAHATGAAPFAIPDGEARAIQLRLSPRALERLRRVGRLDVLAEAYDRSGGVFDRRIHVR